MSQHSINQRLRREGFLIPLYHYKELSIPITERSSITSANKMITELVKQFKLRHPEAKLYGKAVIEAEYDDGEYETYEVLGEILGINEAPGYLIVKDNPVLEEHDWADYCAYWSGHGKRSCFSLHPELTEEPEDKRDCLWIGYEEFITQIYIDRRTTSNHVTSTKLDRIER